MTEGADPDALPVLYSFRRCPYALRARMALAASGTPIELREVLLRDKPAQLLAISAKATVPVLQLTDGRVLDESLTIMHWALQRSDPCAWLDGDQADGAMLIRNNDEVFKPQLDRYKYFVRFPEQSQADYRAQAQDTLQHWERRIARTGAGLIDTQLRLADVAVFPFVRQFAGVDPRWWASAPYPALRRWLQGWSESGLFAAAMLRRGPWQLNAEPVKVDWRCA